MVKSNWFIRCLNVLILLPIVLTACQLSAENRVESEHFIYSPVGEQADPPVALMDELEAEYARITELLQVTTEEKLEIIVYASREEYLEETGFPYWSNGGYFDNGLLLPPSFNNWVAVHELTHVLINRINPDTPRWLNEGIASYVADNLNLPMLEVENAVKQDRIPPFSSYRIVDPTEFMTIQGYPFSYSMIEYIVTEYGWDRLLQLIRSPDDFEGVFQLSGEEFWNNWSQHLEERFK